MGVKKNVLKGIFISKTSLPIINGIINAAYPLSEIQEIKEDLENLKETFKKIDNERVDIFKKYAKKDKKGQLEIKNNSYVVPEKNLKTLNKELDKLVSEKISFKPISIDRIAFESLKITLEQFNEIKDLFY